MKGRANLVRAWAVLSCGLTVGIILFLFGYIFAKGAGAISWQFLTDVPRGVVLGTEGGILPAILGSADAGSAACSVLADKVEGVRA